MRKTNAIVAICLILICLPVFSGCGKTPQPEAVCTEDEITASISEYLEDETVGKDEYYLKTVFENLIYDLPSIDDTWIKPDERRYGDGIYVGDHAREKEGIFFVRKNVSVAGEDIVFLDDICGELLTSYVSLYDNVRYYPQNPFRLQYGSCITIVHKDGSIESHIINNFDISEDGKLYIRDILGMDEEGTLYLYLTGKYETKEDEYYCGKLSSAEGFSLIGELPDECRSKKGFLYDGKIYFSDFDRKDNASLIAPKSKMVYVTDIRDLKECTSFPLNSYVKGFFCSEEKGAFVFGIDDEKELEVRSLDGSGQARAISLSEILDHVADVRIYGTENSDGKVLYITNGNLMWISSGDRTEVIHLAENNILADKIYGILSDDEGFRIMAEYEGEDVLYKVKLVKGGGSAKVVRYAVAYKNPVMEEFIAIYNRSNPDYRVVMETAENVSVEEYAQDISLQIAAGQGPELIDDLLIPPLTACRNGTYAELDDIVGNADNEGLIKPIIDSGKIDGHQYGIPWTASLFYCVVPKKLTGGKSDWGLDDCITDMEKSGYTSFGVNVNSLMSPFKMIMYLGLYDTENGDLIDWDNGKSNLEGESFVKLLEFARKYGSDEVFMNYVNDEAEAVKISGAACDYNDNLGSLNFDYYQFLSKSDDAIWIGFPSKTGGTQYVYAACAYVNSGAENKDGAKDFLAYLISKDGQANLSRISLKHENYEMLSASMVSFEGYVAEYNKKLEGVERSWIGRNGRIDITPIDEETASSYKEMLLSASPIKKELAPIEEIIEEELGAFLQGQKTAEETAKIIDSRVQLYMDENHR